MIREKKVVAIVKFLPQLLVLEDVKKNYTETQKQERKHKCPSLLSWLLLVLLA